MSDKKPGVILSSTQQDFALSEITGQKGGTNLAEALHSVLDVLIENMARHPTASDIVATINVDDEHAVQLSLKFTVLEKTKPCHCVSKEWVERLATSAGDPTRCVLCGGTIQGNNTESGDGKSED